MAGGGSWGLTLHETRALLRHSPVARYCGAHQVVHGVAAGCPECQDLARGAYSGQRPAAPTLPFPRHPEVALRTAPHPLPSRRVRRMWADTAPVWDELPALTPEQHALIYEAPLEDLLGWLRGRIKGLQYGVSLIAEREGVVA